MSSIALFDEPLRAHLKHLGNDWDDQPVLILGFIASGEDTFALIVDGEGDIEPHHISSLTVDWRFADQRWQDLEWPPLVEEPEVPSGGPD